jgi:hypothetical protein
MLATIRDARGQGDAALYVRVRDVVARFWNFVTQTWSSTETAECRVFLVEYQDADTVEARYLAGVTLPADDVVIEYVRASDALVIGEESARTVSASLTGGGSNPVTVQAVDQLGARVAGVMVQAWQGSALLAQAATDGQGRVTFSLPLAVVRLVLSAPAWGAFPEATIEVVVGPQTVNVVGAPLAAPVAPTDPSLCLLYENLRNQDGTPAAGIKGQVEIWERPADYSGALFSGDVVKKTSDAGGLVSWLLPRGTRVQIKIPKFVEGETTIPDAATARIGDLTVA